MRRKLVAIITIAAMFVVLIPNIVFADSAKVTMTDCGHFTGAEDWDDEAVFSAGWQYTNINPETITSIKVTAKDAKERIVVEYTADENQVAWQKKITILLHRV